MSLVRILGIGSPFGADRLGWQAAEYLLEQDFPARYPPGAVRVERLDRPGPLLLRHLEGASLGILIDAMHTGLVPGGIRRLSLAELKLQDPVASSHGLGVAEALQLGQALGQLPPLVILGIEAGGDDELRFDGEGLSVAIGQAIAEVGLSTQAMD